MVDSQTVFASSGTAAKKRDLFGASIKEALKFFNRMGDIRSRGANDLPLICHHSSPNIFVKLFSKTFAKRISSYSRNYMQADARSLFARLRSCGSVEAFTICIETHTYNCRAFPVALIV